MLETLADLHYSYLYEHDAAGSEVCLESSKKLVALSLAVSTLVTTQAAGAAPTLQSGDAGAAVANLQNQLKQANCLPTEGFDPKSYADVIRGAVMNLQMQSNLPIDGIAGPQTYAALAANKKCQELKLGSQGEAVRRMQVQLNNWGFPLNGRRLQPTGVFDTATQQALQDFQKFFGGVFSKADGRSLGSKDVSILWTPRVVALVENLDGERFQWIAPALENLKPSQKAEAVTFTISQLESGNDYDWDGGGIAPAAAVLSILSTDAAKEVPRLLNLLNNKQKNELIRAIAVEALGYLGANPDQVVPALINSAKNKKEDLSIRIESIESIALFKSEAKPAVEALLLILKDKTEDTEIRRKAIVALGEIGSAAQAAIPTLISLLDDKNYSAWGFEDQVQEQSLNAELDRIRELSKNSERSFVDSEGQPSTLREQVPLALAGIGSAAVPELVKALQSSDEKVRYRAAFALSQMQSPAPAAVEPLKAIMNNSNENSNIRWMAASALEIMEQDTQSFFSQNQRQSLGNLTKQTCPDISPVADPAFMKYIGECVQYGTGQGGGRQVAARLMQGRRKRGR